MDAIEREQNQVDNALDFVSKDVDEPQECVKQLERTVEILQQSDAHSQNVFKVMEKTWSKLRIRRMRRTRNLYIIPITTNGNLPKIIRTLGSKLGCTIIAQDMEAVFRI